MNEPELPLSFRLIIAMAVIVTLDLGVTRQGPRWRYGERKGREVLVSITCDCV